MSPDALQSPDALLSPAGPHPDGSVHASPAWMSWSSGKDSALALQVARDELGIEVTALLCTLNAAADRVAMHAVRRELLEAQAQRLGLPLHLVEIPSPCPNDVYEEQMRHAVDVARAGGVRSIVFGDLFLEDVRAYREAALEASQIAAVFPLWGRPTDLVSKQIVDAGVRAVLTCVDPRRVPAELVGRAYDPQLVGELPDGVDPCGERGEFHTFAWDAPGFSSPIPVTLGDVVERDGFVFCDVLPAAER